MNSSSNSKVQVEKAGDELSFKSDQPTHLSDTIGSNKVSNMSSCIGVLDVYIHQARDIHNICIYHNQDVYAKLCLTSDPDTSVSTQIINGGGRNPVFNEKLQLKVQTVDTSLKCEMWMLSRVRNYLEDQLLGFTLVPISEVLGANGELLQDFSLSSTDLFHSPAGFVKMSVSYSGSSPEVVALSKPRMDVSGKEEDDAISAELSKIEFPDPKIVNENEIMVSEYIGIHSPKLESQTPESLVASDDGDHLEPNVADDAEKQEAPQTNYAYSRSSSAIAATETDSSNSLTVSDDVDKISPEKQSGKKTGEEAETEISSASSLPKIEILKIEPEKQVVQQDIVEMYMKSMQEFTDSLAKMKLPMDVIDTSSTTASSSPSTTGDSPTDSKGVQIKGNGSRVFYGSGAFF